MSNKNSTPLERAVRNNDVEAVKTLLAAGAYVDDRINDNGNYDGGTLLYYTRNVEITRLLLLHGAYVNSTNKYRDTPLHCAVTHSKGMAIIRELLKYGANVNATNRKGNTPLNHAVKTRHLQNRELEVVKELMEHGSDINIENRESRFYEDHHSPLDNAISKLECVKLIIKIALIKNFDKDYKRIVNLSPYADFRGYGILSNYFDACVAEIVQMKTQQIKENMSLYEYMARECGKGKITWQEGNEITEEVILNKFPIYRDMILEKVSLERPVLMNKLSETQIYVRRNLGDEENRIVLNIDCTYNLAMFLSSRDLLNLVNAFYKQKDHDQSKDISENIVEIQQEEDKLDETSAKRQKLEPSVVAIE